MTEQNLKGSDEPSRGRKRRSVVKRSKTEAPPDESRAAGGTSTQRNTKQETNGEPHSNRERDHDTFVRIQERAYWLFKASGSKHGHELEHWLEAEKQITGSSENQPNENQ